MVGKRKLGGGLHFVIKLYITLEENNSTKLLMAVICLKNGFLRTFLFCFEFLHNNALQDCVFLAGRILFFNLMNQT